VIRRRWWRPAAVAAVISAGVLGFASPAFAHAQLLETSPASGAVLATPPAQVILTFGEAVQAPPTAIEIFSADGQQLYTGPAGHPPGQPDQVAVALPGSLKGTYVVSWRVISADTHPVQGAFTFSVGAPSEGNGVGALEERLLAARHPSQALGALTGALRTLILLAVLVTVGVVGILVRWPSGLERTEVQALLLGATLLTAAASVAAVLVQGPYDAGKPLGQAFRSNVLSPVLHSNFGTGAAVRIGSSLLILAGVLAAGRQCRQAAAGRRAAVRARGPIPSPGLLVAATGCVGLVVSLSLSGHATTGRWEPFAFIADLIHIGAAAIWVGGLLVLATVLTRRGASQDATELGAVVRRFSATAVWAVGLIVASGVFQAWRQLGSWKALTDTDYGTLLLLKVTLVIATIEAGWFSRRWVANRLMTPAAVGTRGHDGAEAVGAAAIPQGRRDGPGAATASAPLAPTGAEPAHGGPTAPRFRRWLAFEAALGIGIVALTGALIDAAPPQGETVAAASRTYTAHAPVGSDVLSVAVYPLVAGPVNVAIQLTDRATKPVDAFQVTAQVSQPSRHIGPINVPLTHQFTGSWVADNVLLPVGGHWRLQVSVLTDPITEIDRTFTFTIYG
jgi:copper transport protein